MILHSHVSDIQVIAGAIITAGGTIAASLAAAIRWGVVRLATAQDRGTNALIRNAESHAELVARFDVLAERIAQRIAQLDDKLDRIAEAVGQDVRDPDAARVRTQRWTSPRGIPALPRGGLELERVPRRRTEDDTE
jgi:hypothetical protein